MKQGTVSILIGCHSPIHSLLVILAWKKLYKSFPKPWQIVCIFLHDIGHYGLDYLDDYEQKKLHWYPGAKIAEKLFGDKGYNFTGGHCSHSNLVRSKMYKADKYSWYIAPWIWIYINCIFEPKLATGLPYYDATNKFKEQVRESIDSGEFKSTHSMYIDRIK